MVDRLTAARFLEAERRFPAQIILPSDRAAIIDDKVGMRVFFDYAGNMTLTLLAPKRIPVLRPLMLLNPNGNPLSIPQDDRVGILHFKLDTRNEIMSTVYCGEDLKLTLDRSRENTGYFIARSTSVPKVEYYPREYDVRKHLEDINK